MVEDGQPERKSPERRIYDARGNGSGEISPTLTGDHQSRITDYTAIVLELWDAGGADSGDEETL